MYIVKQINDLIQNGELMTIAGSEKPTLTSQIKNQDSVITTWSNINAGDTLRFNVDSVSNVTKVTLIINGISNGL